MKTFLSLFKFSPIILTDIKCKLVQVMTRGHQDGKQLTEPVMIQSLDVHMRYQPLMG